MFESLHAALVRAEADGVSLGELALRAEAEGGLRTREEVEHALRRALEVMRRAVERGRPATSGACRASSAATPPGCATRAARSPAPSSPTCSAGALAVQEVNAAMGVIVAAPTAGGAGVLPGVLLGIARRVPVTDEQLVRGLAAAGLVGAVVAVRASLSGAEGGCQAETGAAAAMAAAAGVEVLGGTPEEASHAVALAMQGTLGLVCDPLGGLVEVPCVFRNATGGAIALAAIEMALAGIRFPIPADEVIDTMGEIGRSMDVRYRETAGGGLAATPTGRKLARDRLVQLKRSGT